MTRALERNFATTAGVISALALGALLAGCSPEASSCASVGADPNVPAPIGCSENPSHAGEATGLGGASNAGSGGANSSGGASALANFATVVQIVQVQCGGSGCHSSGQAPNLLGVDNATLYSTLKSYVVAGCNNYPLISPGAPDQSAFYLVQKGQCSATVPQMPLGCVDNCTPQTYLDGVREWIANGAPQQ